MLDGGKLAQASWIRLDIVANECLNFPTGIPTLGDVKMSRKDLAPLF
jgi:hypothetical protein